MCRILRAPLHRIRPQTKLIAEDGDVSDDGGRAPTAGQRGSRRASCSCRLDRELGVGVMAQTSHRLTSNSASCTCALSGGGGCVCVEKGRRWCWRAFASRAETAAGCDYVTAPRSYFCPFLRFLTQTTRVTLDSRRFRPGLMLLHTKWVSLSHAFAQLMSVYQHPLSAS